jgi:hypothetical protein
MRFKVIKASLDGICGGEKKPMNIAHVGAYKRFSDADGNRTATVMLHLLKHGFNNRGKIYHDVINLKYGRDFLAENIQYDLIILHSIFQYDNEDNSSHHNNENWRIKLSQSGAKFIAICEGQPCTLSGWQIGEIPGYAILERNSAITIYNRLDKDRNLADGA